MARDAKVTRITQTTISRMKMMLPIVVCRDVCACMGIQLTRLRPVESKLISKDPIHEKRGLHDFEGTVNGV